MISSDSTFEHTQKYRLTERATEYDGYFTVERLVFEEQDISGALRTVVRYVFERGDSAGILLHDPFRKTVVLVRQLRYPAVLRNDSAWMLEMVAGALTPGSDPAALAVREVAEETGMRITDPELLGMVYLSPGGSSERCFLYHAAVDSRGLQGRICGEAGTDEQTHVEVIPFKDALQMVGSGSIRDAKTVIALQKLALKEIPGWD